MARWYTMDFALEVSLSGTGCAKGESGEDGVQLVIFHAGSLSIPMRDIAAAFEAKHPGVKVVRESSGSRAAARKITDLGRKCDLMLSADYTVIDQLLLGEHASWILPFVTNEIVLAYSKALPPEEVPATGNWRDLIVAEDARVGHGDPDSDPCGYRALMVLQLAAEEMAEAGFYDTVQQRTVGHIRPKASDLVALLEVAELDYAFLYRSVATQHGIPFLELPTSLNLSDPKLASSYSAAGVEISGHEPGTKIRKVGAPIAYGLTILTTTKRPKLALDFVEFLLHEQHGLKILQQHGQASLVPAPTATYDSLPERLRAYASPPK